MRIPLNSPPQPSTLFGVPDPNAAFGRHAGVDYPVGTGTPVFACIAGQATTRRDVPYHGNVVDIQNGGKWYRVMHLSEILIPDGPVQEGQLIARSGNTDGGTGNNTGPHLHWDIRTQFIPKSFAAFIDPLSLLGKEEEMLDASHQSSLFVAYLGRLPEPTEVDRDVGKKTTDTMINDLQSSSEYADKVQRDQEAYAALAGFELVTEPLFKKKG